MKRALENTDTPISMGNKGRKIGQVLEGWESIGGSRDEATGRDSDDRQSKDTLSSKQVTHDTKKYSEDYCIVATQENDNENAAGGLRIKEEIMEIASKTEDNDIGMEGGSDCTSNDEDETTRTKKLRAMFNKYAKNSSIDFSAVQKEMQDRYQLQMDKVTNTLHQQLMDTTEKAQHNLSDTTQNEQKNNRRGQSCSTPITGNTSNTYSTTTELDGKTNASAITIDSETNTEGKRVAICNQKSEAIGKHSNEEMTSTDRDEVGNKKDKVDKHEGKEGTKVGKDDWKGILAKRHQNRTAIRGNITNGSKNRDGDSRRRNGSNTSRTIGIEPDKEISKTSRKSKKQVIIS